MPLKNAFKTHLLVGLGLLVLTLAAFAVVWPLNSEAYDDWVYYFISLPGVLSSTAVYALRPYAFNGALLANMLMPGQAQNIYVFHVISLFIAAFCFYQVVRMLIPGHTWFALLTAAIYLFYIPSNFAQLIPLHYGVYSWTIAAVGLGFALYVGNTRMRGWRAVSVLAVAAVFGYMAILSYESSFPILVTAPILVWLATRKLSLRFALGALVWWVVCLIAFLQFLIPYLRGDPSTWYQNAFQEVKTLSQFIENTGKFYGQSFPLEKIVQGLLGLLSSPYLGMALFIGLIVALVLALFWRRDPLEQSLPSPRLLVVMFVVGLVLAGLAGAPYIYANSILSQVHFLAVPGQTLVIVSLFGMCAWLLRRYSLATLPVSLFTFTILFFALGSYWYRSYQDRGLVSADFSQRRIMFQSIVNLVPDALDDTLIVYDCTEFNRVYSFRQADTYAARYLYQDRVNLQDVETLTFDHTGITANETYGNLLGPPLPTHYTYDQLIILRCGRDGLSIVNSLPRAWASSVNNYNPYARIVNGFIQPRQALILAR